MQPQPHQQRVVNEKVELDIKLEALNQFIDNSNVFSALDSEDQGYLRAQAYAMRAYSDILGDRITKFK